MEVFKKFCFVCGKELKEYQQKYCSPSHRVKACRDRDKIREKEGYSKTENISEEQWWFERIKECLIEFLNNYDMLNNNKFMKEFADKMRDAYAKLKNGNGGSKN